MPPPTNTSKKASSRGLAFLLLGVRLPFGCCSSSPANWTPTQRRSARGSLASGAELTTNVLTPSFIRNDAAASSVLKRGTLRFRPSCRSDSLRHRAHPRRRHPGNRRATRRPHPIGWRTARLHRAPAAHRARDRPRACQSALLLALYAGGQRMAQLLRAKAREAERAKQEGRAPERAGLWLFSTHGRVAMTPRP